MHSSRLFPLGENKIQQNFPLRAGADAFSGAGRFRP